jgi:hypothetical protein
MHSHITLLSPLLTALKEWESDTWRQQSPWLTATSHPAKVVTASIHLLVHIHHMATSYAFSAARITDWSWRPTTPFSDQFRRLGRLHISTLFYDEHFLFGYGGMAFWKGKRKHSWIAF